MGNQDNDTSVPIQKTQGRNMGCLPCENVQFGQRDGYGWDCPSCMKELQRVCGAPWGGSVTEDPMR